MRSDLAEYGFARDQSGTRTARLFHVTGDTVNFPDVATVLSREQIAALEDVLVSLHAVAEDRLRKAHAEKLAVLEAQESA